MYPGRMSSKLVGLRGMMCVCVIIKTAIRLQDSMRPKHRAFQVIPSQVGETFAEEEEEEEEEGEAEADDAEDEEEEAEADDDDEDDDEEEDKPSLSLSLPQKPIAKN
jgi:hypothetical protein